ncbi:hypothetical protein R6Q59_017477 [Mikania micrantha]|uniref:Uncharacterized protein n=1 Tax=Mikania micrantha TaxID=192012 RepID=A0A5N6M3J6_9ASTR|nr:hypothetical protein E3N88_36390 [Mikania micrantha]
MALNQPQDRESGARQVPPPSIVENVEMCESNNPSLEDENHPVLVPDAASNTPVAQDDERSINAFITEAPEDDEPSESGPRNDLQPVVQEVGLKRPRGDDSGGARKQQKEKN